MVSPQILASQSFKKGDSVSINNKYFGKIQYIGPIENKDGIWVGIELNKPVGKNNGTYMGIKYFDCRPNYGIFVKENKIKHAIDNVNTVNDKKDNEVIDLSLLDSNLLNTEEIINKYANYSNYNVNSKMIDNLEHSSKLNESFIYNINQTVCNNLEKMLNKINIIYNELSMCSNQMVNLINNYKISTDHSEHQRIVNLVEKIYQSYKNKDIKHFNEYYTQFQLIMKRYNIKL